MLAGSVHEPAQHRRETESHNRRRKLAMSFFALIISIVALLTICYNQFLHQPVKDSMPEHYAQYVYNVKQRYKTRLHDVAQSFWLPADMDTFIQLSLTTSQNKPRAPKVDQYSANERIVSERSMSFSDLLSEIDASPGSRILVVGQPGIGKTTLLQRITRSWAHDRALSSCWILLHIVLRDLVLLQHSPNLTTFLSFMENTWLPPDIETHVFESDGKGLCFIADGLDEYPAGYEDKTTFIFSLIRAQKLPQSTVVISSRPEVASHVWHSFNKRVEVLGFGNDQINEYIQAKYGEDKSFSKYLDGHPHIKHTCYVPLHLAMLVYLKDSLLDNLPETETEMYKQFVIHRLIWSFCKNDTSCSSKNTTLPTSLNNIDELNSPENERLLFHVANLSYNGIWKRQSSFNEKEVEPVLWSTNSSLLVVDKMNIHKPATYSFPHLTIQEFLAAFYFNTYLNQTEQKRVLKYSKQQIRYRDNVYWVFWKFCCGLKRNENQTTFLEFFNLLYQYNNRSILPYHCAYEAQSLTASQQLMNFTKGITKLYLPTYYDTASFAFVAVSAAQNLLEIHLSSVSFPRVFLHKLCDATTVFSQLRRVHLLNNNPFNIGCLLQKSPNLESLRVYGTLDWGNLQSEDAAALVLPPYGTTLLKIRNICLDYLNIGDKGVKKLSQFLQDSIFSETLSLKGNGITDNGASAIAGLMKVLPRLQHLYLDGNHIGDKGVEKLSQLQDSIFLETLSLHRNGITDKGASAIADLMKTRPSLRHVHLAYNHIGGTGAALLWNQSICKCCNLSLSQNVIGDDRSDAFISALNDTVNNGHERNKSCHLVVNVYDSKFLCSDLDDIHTISKKLPKGVTLRIGSDCLNMTEKIMGKFIYYVLTMIVYGSDKIGLQWMYYKRGLGLIVCTACTFFFTFTITPRWKLFCCSCCVILYILSLLNYLGFVDFILSFLWSWIVVGRLIFFVSLKLLFKPWGWVLIVAVMIQLYFIDFIRIAYQLFAVLYIVFILGYVLFCVYFYVLRIILYLLLQVL